MIIRSRAPARITFGGGGTDISPYDENYGGICIGAAINKYSYCTLKKTVSPEIRIDAWKVGENQTFTSLDELKYDGNLDLVKAAIKTMKPSFGFELYLRSDLNLHSGLGGSASASASLMGVFNYLRDRNQLSSSDIAENSFLIEEKLKNRGGRQDQYAAVFGGINLYEFFGGKFVRVNPVKMKDDSLLELEKNLLVVHTGEREKSSGEVQNENIKQGLYTEKEKIEQLHEIKNIAIEVEYALRKGNLQRFGELIRESWEYKKKFNPQVTNPNIDELNRVALKNGALGGRLMGAGGGGHMLFYCYPNKEQVVREKLEGLGAKVLDFSFDFKGLQTWEVEA